MNEMNKEFGSSCNDVVAASPTANELSDPATSENGTLANSVKETGSSQNVVDSSERESGSGGGDCEKMDVDNSTTTTAAAANEIAGTKGTAVVVSTTTKESAETSTPKYKSEEKRITRNAKTADTPSPEPAQNTTLNKASDPDHDSKSGGDGGSSKNTVVPEVKQSTPVADVKTEAPPVRSTTKRYIYKLKAKSGKVLRYTSSIPIVLKKPVITLTKMEELFKSEKLADDEADSDNSTKENHHVKENDASGDGVARQAKRKGRPPLSQKAPIVPLDDRNSSDTGDSNKMTSSFTMQTRKRQLRFLPDGRVVPPGKKLRPREAKSNRLESTSSESDDLEFTSDEDSPPEPKYKKSSAPGPASKKFSSLERKIVEKKGKPSKKVFDFESYMREKSSASSTTDEKPERIIASTPKATVDSQLVKSGPLSTSTPAPKKSSAVDPAQLLSSLIGVPITPNQLNVVKFKPKVIQERKNNSTLTPKKVTFHEDKLVRQSAPASQTELLKNTPYKLVSKPLFQKILPKPSLTPLKPSTPILRKPMDRTVPASTPLKPFTPIAPKMTTNNAGKESLDFKSFTDTRIVKTKEGPKKAPQRGPPETVYDLLRDVFEQMPSWNLHVIPDTNSFCIAQVSRGRMGIPILKKSIELNSEFFAKVYVHQLHCKRYDGVYDTESKILTLIKEIDSLAA